MPIRNQLRRALTAKTRKRHTIAAATKPPNDDETEEPTAPRRHQTLTVTIYGHPIRVLLDTGAIPNLLSLAVAQKIGVRTEQSKATIRVANGDTAQSVGEVRNLPVTFDDMVVPLDFIVLENSVFGMILGNPTLENLQMCYNLAKQEVSLCHGNNAVRLPLEYYPSYEVPLTDRYSDFTSLTDYDSEADMSEVDDHEVLANHVGLISMLQEPPSEKTNTNVDPPPQDPTAENDAKTPLLLPIPTFIHSSASMTTSPIQQMPSYSTDNDATGSLNNDEKVQTASNHCANKLAQPTQLV